MAEFKRKKGESFEAFLRRFNKSLQYSKKLIEARQKQYVKPKKSRNMKKKSALVGLKLRSKKEYMIKTGKLKEEDLKRW